jgi:thiol:disulfide interchange protein DsbD
VPSDARVISQMDRFVRLKGNLTVENPVLSKQYAIIGVPTLVFLDSAGKEVTDARLTGFEPPDDFLKRMARVQ